MSDQTPSGPDFVPPQSHPSSAGWPPQQPGQPWAPPEQPPAPLPQPGWAARPPVPARTRRRWPAAVGLAAAVAIVAAGALSVPSLLSPPAAAPASTSTALPLVTVTPSAQPADQTVLTTGGDLGSTAAFTSSTGTGTLTITRATWTQAGRMAPPNGQAYLIVEATVACTGGTLDVSSLSLRTTSQPADQSAFGADLPHQFPGVRLSRGEKQSGQIGFVLAAAPVEVALLDAATLRPVVIRAVPAP